MAITKEEASKGVRPLADRADQIKAAAHIIEKQIDQRLRERYPNQKEVLILLNDGEILGYSDFVGSDEEGIIEILIQEYREAG